MNGRAWTDTDVKYLKDNYPTGGMNHCATVLNRTKMSIQKKAQKLGIQAPGRLKTNEQYLAELDNKNIDYIPQEQYAGTETPILHSCVQNHIWKVRQKDILRGYGCPSCANTGIDRTKPGKLYFVSFEYDNNTYYKLGITTRTVRERFAGDWNRFKVAILWEQDFLTAQEAYDKEYTLLKANKANLLNLGILKSGNTEILTKYIEKEI